MKFQTHKQENWPKEGLVEFKDVTMRYFPHFPPVLTKVSVRFEPGKKVGVAGRTGSGKTSLLMALFR